MTDSSLARARQVAALIRSGDPSEGALVDFLHGSPAFNRALEARDPASGPYLGTAGSGFDAWCRCGHHSTSPAELDAHELVCTLDSDLWAERLRRGCPD